MKTSNFLSLNWRDFVKGLFVAILTSPVLAIQQSIEAGDWVFNWRLIAMSGIAGGIGYLIKNFFTQPVEVQKIGGGQIPPIKDEK